MITLYYKFDQVAFQGNSHTTANKNPHLKSKRKAYIRKYCCTQRRNIVASDTQPNINITSHTDQYTACLCPAYTIQ